MKKKTQNNHEMPDTNSEIQHLSNTTKAWNETKKIWRIAVPAMLLPFFQFSLGFVTIAFAGRLGDVQLSAATIIEDVTAVYGYAIVWGMSGALETVCGQVVGTGEINTLGIYLQRSWIICLSTSVILTPLYLFTSPILNLFRQSKDISRVAGNYVRWATPQLFAYALNFPLQKFYQSQSKLWVITAISGVALGVHVLLNWIFVIRLGKGLFGAAMAGNISWWLINFAQFAHLFSGRLGEAWGGFSRLAFRNLLPFLKLSLMSGIMLCLELWYYTVVPVLVGRLENPEILVGAVSICMNYELWVYILSLGFFAAVSVRVSNELGAKNVEAPKLSIMIALTTSTFIGLIFAAVFLFGRNELPKFFTDKPDVIHESSKLGQLLAASILLNSIEAVLAGVAVGAGWQYLVLIINAVSFYFVGLPLGAILGFKLKMKTRGIWLGMLTGVILQTSSLAILVLRTSWKKEALSAEKRIRDCGGHQN